MKPMTSGKKKSAMHSNISSGVANCMAIEQHEEGRTVKPKKGEVTGKITGAQEVGQAPAPYSEEYHGEECPPQGEPQSETAPAQTDKEEAMKHYREMLEYQIEAKRAAAQHEKELLKGGTGLQLGSMSRPEESNGPSMEMKEAPKMSSAAMEMQAYNKQMAMQRAQEKAMAKKGEFNPVPQREEPVPEPMQEEAPGMFSTPTMMQNPSIQDAGKKEKAQKLKEALQVQMMEDKARKLQDKQERMGYKKI